MTTHETADLIVDIQTKLAAYARKHGALAANALIAQCATDTDLTKVTGELQAIRSSDGHPVRLGPGLAREIIVKLTRADRSGTLYDPPPPAPRQEAIDAPEGQGWYEEVPCVTNN